MTKVPGKKIVVILLVAFVARLVFAFRWHEVLWDSGVYIGMGKFLWSNGASGLWEHIRPPFVPIMLGFLWKVGLNPIVWGRLVEIVLMMGVVWLTFDLGRTWFDDEVGAVAAVLVGLSPIFFNLSFHQYTEIPSVFFGLLGLWFLQKEKVGRAGVSFGLAFLAKFPAGIFLPIVLVMCGFERKWKKGLLLVVGFLIATSSYFLASWWWYGGPFATLIAAQLAIKQVLGCNMLRAYPWWSYFSWIFLETPVYVFGIVGTVVLLKEWKKNLLFLGCLFVPFAYFMGLHCREYRYVTLFLPFVAMASGLGLVFVYSRLTKRRKMFWLVLVFVGLWLGVSMIRFEFGNDAQIEDRIASQYVHAINKTVEGEIWVSNPVVAAFTNAPLQKVYYPVYSEQSSMDFLEYVRQNRSKIGMVLLDNCGGGIVCAQGDDGCERRTVELVEELQRSFVLVLNQSSGRCWYNVWSTV